MGYLEDYQKRVGHCEYCTHRRDGLYCGNECYGSNFIDKLSLFDFIRENIKQKAISQFDQTEQGAKLKKDVEIASVALKKASWVYEDEKEKFVQSQLDKLNNQINSLGE